MPSRYLFQDLQDLKDLPDFIESHFKEVKKEITGLVVLTPLYVKM